MFEEMCNFFFFYFDTQNVKQDTFARKFSWPEKCILILNLLKSDTFLHLFPHNIESQNICVTF